MTQKEKTVHFCKSPKVTTTNLIEESENDEPSTSNDQYLTNWSSTAVKSGGDMQSASSISTSILDDADEIKELKMKLAACEAKCKILEMNHDRANAELNNERNKNMKLEKKLQFVKDNQEVFMRLKEAYINMKYNEAAGRKMIEVREKCIQTWEGIVCRACIETEELRRKLEATKETYKNALIVSPGEVEQMVNTINYLGDILSRREKYWNSYVEKSHQFQAQISILQNENSTLKTLVQTQQDQIQEQQIPLTSASDLNAELTQLKKIIIKYEKCFKEIHQNHHQDLIIFPHLNDKEKHIVQQLMLKYYSRLNKKKSRSLSVNQRSTARSSSRSIRSKSGTRGLGDIPNPEILRSQNSNADVTIRMIEYLFDGPC